MKADISEAALAQVRSISRFVSADDEGMASQFIQAFRAEVEYILKWPELCPVARLSRKHRNPTRYRVMRPPFRHYLVFYRIEGSTLVVGSVLWGGMNWQEDLSVF